MRRRLTQPAHLKLPAGEQQIALANGRKLWVTRVPRAEWRALQPGHQLLVLRASRRCTVSSLEPCEVHKNALVHPAAPCIALIWGWLAPGKPDTRHATILRLHELAVVLRYELRETATPDVVATILPTPN
ncbi:hypothetical protein BEN47_05065 [Hymenobacter lapidarius]|uniref:Uncharacterized protein n=1 Tax=Hymenobacter lapidarius TaxID=1908237 RepID=A0A1G1STP0_9BACT|nr:hypothetical protein [Hymenobacter lapidarius]OGX81992.1 hypothetical protein BEN47_05065 [Hymenobacter lapidarius]